MEVFKLEFHDADTDTDILARILADTSDTRHSLKLFPWQAERHADYLATILARMSMSVSASWNASFTSHHIGLTCGIAVDILMKKLRYCHPCIMTENEWTRWQLILKNPF